jgi:hypothetical protein
MELLKLTILLGVAALPGASAWNPMLFMVSRVALQDALG